MKKCILILITAFAVINLSAQQSGNSVYSNSRYSSYSKPAVDAKLFLTDSTFIIEGSIMKNVIADGYVATIGLAEESTSLKDCNEKINKRIKDFTADLEKFGIQKNDIYIDMTTQNKIYDYNITSGLAEQYLKGFELKKNVIFKFTKIGDMDEILIIAAKYKIFDLVKIDYIVNDIESIYNELFQTAKSVIDKKKSLYTSATGCEILANKTQIYADQFVSYYPHQLYKSYVAYETTDYYDYNGGTKKKDLRNSPTFYYDKASYSGFDKVINPYVIEPAVEFVLTLQMKFQTKK